MKALMCFVLAAFVLSISCVKPRPQLRPGDRIAIGGVAIKELKLEVQAAILYGFANNPGVRMDDNGAMLDCQTKWRRSGKFERWAVCLECRLGNRYAEAEYSHALTREDRDVNDEYAVRQAAFEVAEKLSGVKTPDNTPGKRSSR